LHRFSFNSRESCAAPRTPGRVVSPSRAVSGASLATSPLPSPWSASTYIPSPQASPYRSPAPSPQPPGSPRSPRSPYHSTATSPLPPGSPRSPYSPRGRSPLPRRSPSPRSQSPHPVRNQRTRFASQPPALTQGNLAMLASRRKSLACGRPRPSPQAGDRRTSNFLELPVADYGKRRICSLPEGYNPRISEEYYRLRSFSINKGRLIKHGDSIASRRSRSPCSTTATNTSRSVSRAASPYSSSCMSPRSPMGGGGYPGSSSNSGKITPDLPDDDNMCKLRICLMGMTQVGKSSLVSQCLTSEYINTYDASLDEEYGEKSVSVALDGQEAELTFIDHASDEMSVENILSTYEPHACMVVYSIVDRDSFLVAESILEYMTRGDQTKRASILVGNKADMERSRQVSAKGPQTTQGVHMDTHSLTHSLTN